MDLDTNKAKRDRKKTVFHFLDYRQYLQELFTQLKDLDESFSYRAFARLAESSSPNFLQLIMSGTLKISSAQTVAFSKNVSLKKKEHDYLNALIEFDHSDSHNDKNRVLKKIISMRESRTVNHLAEHQYNYLSNWYNPVIRELICSSKYTDSPQWLEDKLVPAVGLRDINKSIFLLKELNLIERNNNDTGWIQVDSIIATPDEVMSIAVVEYHKEMLKRAEESLQLFTGSQRDIRSVTLGISQKHLPELKEKMATFWNEIMVYAEEVDESELVVQINTQLFPLSQVEDNK